MTSATEFRKKLHDAVEEARKTGEYIKIDGWTLHYSAIDKMFYFTDGRVAVLFDEIKDVNNYAMLKENGHTLAVI